MSSATEQADIGVIKEKLQAYRRKFYANRLLRGSVVVALLLSTLFVTFVLSEGLLWLSPAWRTTLFAVLVGGSALAAAVLVLGPLLKYLNIGTTLTDDEAARAIGRHFPEIDDKLVNLLQLSQDTAQNRSLILAAIQARIDQLRPVPFTLAVNFKPNYRLARYLALPLLLLVLMLIVNPDLVTSGMFRLVNFSKTFVPPAPFDVQVPNHRKQFVEGETFSIDIKLSGKELPGELYLYLKHEGETRFTQYSLQKENLTKYAYTFKNARRDFEYYIGNELHGSAIFSSQALKRPAVGNFYVVLRYPGYTGIEPETLSTNVGDINALYGTQAEWHFEFKGPVDKGYFQGLDKTALQFLNDAKTEARFTRTLLKDESYTFNLLSNKQVANADTVRYAIKLVADKYPMVYIQKPAYEAALPKTGILSLTADFSDDFGFSQARLYYRFVKAADPTKQKDEFQSVPLQIKPGSAFTQDQAVDFIGLGMAEGDEVEYYVKAWDNDGVQGPKASVSLTHKLTYKSAETLYNEIADINKKVEQELDKAKENSQELQKDFEAIKQKMLEKQNLSYEDKQQIKSMVEKQAQLLNQLEQSQKKIEQTTKQAKQNDLLTPETIKKMEELQQLIKEYNDPEFKKLLDELQKQLNDLNKLQMQKKLEQMEQKSENYQENIERALELFKQLKVDQKVEELMNKLDDLKEKQDMLQDKLDQAKDKNEMQAVQQKQQELAKEMQEALDDLKALQELKADTQSPDSQEMDDLQEMGDDAKEQMDQAGQQMQQGNKNKAKQNQQKSGQQLQKMMEKLDKMQTDSEMEEKAENYEDLRNLLENLLKLSFEQEDLRNQITVLQYNDPKLVAKVQQQQKIRDDMLMIRDSLVELSKRVFEIKKMVMDELTEIDNAMNRAFAYLGQKQLPMARSEQHGVMTHTNNLANMLVESLDQMQQQMQQMKNASGQGKMCKKPNSQGNSMQKLGEMQKQLNQQLQQMMQQGGTDPKMLNELAKQQEQIRQQLSEAFEKLKQEGGGGLGDLSKIQKDMEKTEDELKKEQLTAEMLMRQQQILNRMLDFDKAMREQEFDETRESTTGDELDKVPPADLKPDQLQQIIRKEQYNKSKYPYTPAYQSLIDKYYEIINK